MIWNNEKIECEAKQILKSLKRKQQMNRLQIGIQQHVCANAPRLTGDICLGEFFAVKDKNFEQIA